MALPMEASRSRRSQYESQKCQEFLPLLTCTMIAEDPENEARILQPPGAECSTCLRPPGPYDVVDRSAPAESLSWVRSSSKTNCMSASPPAWAKNHMPRFSRLSMKSSRSRTVWKLWYRSTRSASPSSSSPPTRCQS